MRTLGILTLTDRLIQQALHQVLSPIFEVEFSESSLRFPTGEVCPSGGPGGAAVCRRRPARRGDMDLEKFFDRVNHDILMAKLAKRIGDGRVLKLSGSDGYLEAGMMAEGVVSPRTEGTPGRSAQSAAVEHPADGTGSGTERRGHAFRQSADDCNIYVRSQAAGERVLAGISQFFRAAQTQVNDKSAVARPWGAEALATA